MCPGIVIALVTGNYDLNSFYSLETHNVPGEAFSTD